jgi:hypothetical protein
LFIGKRWALKDVTGSFLLDNEGFGAEAYQKSNVEAIPLGSKTGKEIER